MILISALLRFGVVGGIVVTLLSGCAFNKATGPIYSPHTLSDSNKAMVYVYRPSGESFGSDRTYFLTVNQHKVVDLLHGGYFPLEVSPGKLTLASDVNRTIRTSLPLIGAVIEAGANPKAAHIDIVVEAENVYYISMHPETSFTHFTPHLRLIPVEVGEREIADCKLIINSP